MDFSHIASDESIFNVEEGLKTRNFEPLIVSTKEEALAKIKEFIPSGASVNNGSSRTLEEIGFIDYLKSEEHPWNNLHKDIIAETDPQKKAELRKKAVFSDYYLGSVHGLTETGEIIIASASGSQLPSVVFTSTNLIFVVGAQKITATFDEAMKRLREYVYPLEDARMKSVNMGGSVISKVLLFETEPAFTQRKVRVIIVKEKLGF